MQENAPVQPGVPEQQSEFLQLHGLLYSVPGAVSGAHPSQLHLPGSALGRGPPVRQPWGLTLVPKTAEPLAFLHRPLHVFFNFYLTLLAGSFIIIFNEHSPILITILKGILLRLH